MEYTLDCKEIKCPMPIVRISQQIKKMDVGDVLNIEAMDPAFPADLKAWATTTRNEIVSLDADSDPQTAVVRKS